jgi:hypothetical protein
MTVRGAGAVSDFIESETALDLLIFRVFEPANRLA